MPSPLDPPRAHALRSNAPVLPSVVSLPALSIDRRLLATIEVTPFRIPARKSFRIRSYRNPARNSFRIRSYGKPQGGGVAKPSASQLSPPVWELHPNANCIKVAVQPDSPGGVP